MVPKVRSTGVVSLIQFHLQPLQEASACPPCPCHVLKRNLSGIPRHHFFICVKSGSQGKLDSLVEAHLGFNRSSRTQITHVRGSSAESSLALGLGFAFFPVKGLVGGRGPRSTARKSSGELSTCLPWARKSSGNLHPHKAAAKLPTLNASSSTSSHKGPPQAMGFTGGLRVSGFGIRV